MNITSNDYIVSKQIKHNSQEYTVSVHSQMNITTHDYIVSKQINTIHKSTQFSPLTDEYNHTWLYCQQAN